jgi:CRISPR system Cascade subunit CasD
MHYLLLWFEGPLQSWGTDSKFNRRATNPFPSRSGVVGLICAALGAGGEQAELLSELSLYSQTVLSYSKQQEKAEVELRDFHMVGSGYDEKDPWQLLHIPKTMEGKKANGGGAKLTYRYYLQNAKFAVILELPQSLDYIADALRQPVWDIYLGRKNCAPTDFIFQAVFNDFASAEEAAQKLADEKGLKEIFRVLEGEHDGDILILNDVPVKFGRKKVYKDRVVTVVKKIG